MQRVVRLTLDRTQTPRCLVGGCPLVKSAMGHSNGTLALAHFGPIEIKPFRPSALPVYNLQQWIVTHMAGNPVPSERSLQQIETCSTHRKVGSLVTGTVRVAISLAKSDLIIVTNVARNAGLTECPSITTKRNTLPIPRLKSRQEFVH